MLKFLKIKLIKYFKKEEGKQSQPWWYMPGILVLRKQKQDNLNSRPTCVMCKGPGSFLYREDTGKA